MLTINLFVILIGIVGSSGNGCEKEVVPTRHSSNAYPEVTPGHSSDSAALALCGSNELRQSSSTTNEIPALEAIQILHRQLDDDKNGNVDLSESDEFLREELQYEGGYQKRHENFHKDNDDQISEKELWSMWVKSPVHNWTIDQTVDWVGTVVELPHLQERFRQFKINGSHLPRIAANHQNFLTVYLGIKDIIARQKLSLKAQDVVLFGPPKDNSSHTKDIIYIVLLMGATSVIYWVYCRNVKMSKDMKALKKSEKLLRELQKDLEQAKRDEESSVKEGFLNDIVTPKDTDEVNKLQNEVKLLRTKLHRAEVELQLKRWIPPPELIYYLQVTYDRETKEHKRKQEVAEKLLRKASKTCEKLKKRRSSIINAFIPIHSRSIDDVDLALLNAKTALEEISEEYKERMYRWNGIEMLLNPDVEIQADSRSVSIISSESWSHSRSLIGTVHNVDAMQMNDCSTSVTGGACRSRTAILKTRSVLEIQNMEESILDSQNSPNIGASLSSDVRITPNNMVNREGADLKYPSWQKVKRLLKFEGRGPGIHKVSPIIREQIQLQNFNTSTT